MMNPINKEFRDVILNHVGQLVKGTDLDNTEIEFRLVSFEKNKFTQTLSQFRTISDNLQKYYPKVEETYSLDIIIDRDRVTISTLDEIKKYCQSEDLSTIQQKNLTYIIKTKEKNSSRDIKEYNLRIGVAKEVPSPITEEVKQRVKSDISKFYRYKHRYSFLGHPQLRFDLTSVKSGDGHSLRRCMNRGVHILQSSEEYEVEIELTKLKTLPLTIDDDVVLNIYRCVKWSQNGFAIMKMDNKGYPIEEETIRTEFVRTTYPGSRIEDTKDRRLFIGMNVYPLTSSNFSSIKKGYSVTEKADGERFLLIVSNSEGYQGNLYLISNQLTIKHTGLMTNTPSLYGSIYDGELVLTNDATHTYLMFDCLFYAGRDVRDRPLTSVTADNKIDDKNSRYGLVKSSIAELKTNTTVLANEANLKFNNKVYKFCLEGQSIFSLADEVNKNKYDYNLDGLILTPYQDTYPVTVIGKSITWQRLLKWKPLNQTSIDFAIEIISRMPVINILTGARYVEAKLKVNHQDGTAIDFVPARQPSEYDPKFNLIRLVVGDTGLPRAKDNNFIYTKSIVEFIYDDSKPKWFKWIPLRVRFDKVTSNSQYVVDSTWGLIMNPVTLDMITKGSEIKSKDQYFSDIGVEKGYLVEPMKNYHRAIKELLLRQIKDRLRKPGTKTPIDMLDLACGQGGDLHTWHSNEINVVVGVEYDYLNLFNPERGAKARMDAHRNENISHGRRAYPSDLYLIWGDASKSLNDGSAGLDNGNALLLKEILNSRGPASFDIVSCQFAFHYFTGSLETFKMSLYNASYNLKMGGYFVGTTLDGKKVHQKLDQKSEIEGKIGDDVLWKLTRQYTGPFANLGQKITAYNISIGKDIDEYLVNFDYMVELAGQYGLQLIPDNEVPKLKGIESFGDVYDKILSTSSPRRIESIKKMTNEEKDYSFMSSYFIFKKVSNPKSIQTSTSTSTPTQKGPDNTPSKNVLIRKEPKKIDEVIVIKKLVEPEVTVPKKTPVTKKLVEPEVTVPKKTPVTKKPVEPEVTIPKKTPVTKKPVEPEVTIPKKTLVTKKPVVVVEPEPDVIVTKKPVEPEVTVPKKILVTKKPVVVPEPEPDVIISKKTIVIKKPVKPEPDVIIPKKTIVIKKPVVVPDVSVTKPRIAPKRKIVVQEPDEDEDDDEDGRLDRIIEGGIDYSDLISDSQQQQQQQEEQEQQQQQQQQQEEEQDTE
jgi:hypothetical protein